MNGDGSLPDAASNASSGILRALGEAIRRQRWTRNLTIEQLAIKAALSYQYLSEIETGKRNVSILVLDRLAQALGSSVHELAGAAERLRGSPPAASADSPPAGRD